MSQKKKRLFVDTNVFVDYILGKEIIGKNNQKEIPFYSRLKQSINFLDNFFDNKGDVILSTTFLNICEMQSSLVEAGVKGRMFKKGISFNYYTEYLNKFLKQENYKKDIEKAVEKYHKLFIKHKLWYTYKIGFKSQEDFEEIDKLKIKFRLPTLDALIFFMAKKDGDFFVTNDHHHFLKNKKLKEEYKRQIKILSPSKALEILKMKT